MRKISLTKCRCAICLTDVRLEEFTPWYEKLLWWIPYGHTVEYSAQVDEGGFVLHYVVLCKICEKYLMKNPDVAKAIIDSKIYGIIGS